MTSRWYQTYGTEAQPLRQSSLKDLAGQYGCAKRFHYDVEEELAGGPAPRPTVSWKPTMGTAVHESIRRGLERAWAQLSDPRAFSDHGAATKLRANLSRVLREEMLREAAGRRIEWYDAKEDTEMLAGTWMAFHGLRTVVERAARIIACELPFRVPFGGYETEGTIDLLFEPRSAPGTVELADFKTGAALMHQIERDHGYQTGLYAHAVHYRLGVFPRATWIVHLRDFVPRMKQSRKGPAGSLRGPGWYASQRAPADDRRLEHGIKTVVRKVRLGIFEEQIGEQCARCPHRGPCLTDGHGPTQEEARAAERVLKSVDLSGIESPDVAA